MKIANFMFGNETHYHRRFPARTVLILCTRLNFKYFIYLYAKCELINVFAILYVFIFYNTNIKCRVRNKRCILYNCYKLYPYFNVNIYNYAAKKLRTLNITLSRLSPYWGIFRLKINSRS